MEILESSPPYKRKRRKALKTSEEIELEKEVIGTSGSVFNESDHESDSSDSSEGEIISEESSGFKARWKDDDDDDDDDNLEQVCEDDNFSMFPTFSTKKNTKKRILKKKFKKIVGVPSWAKIDLNKKKEKEDDIIRIAGTKIKKSKSLSSVALEVLVCRNLVSSSGGLGRIVNVDFHKQLQTALVAGTRERIVICKVDGSTNEIMQTIKFDDHRLTNAEWTADGRKIITTAFKRKHLFIYDAISEKTTTLYLNSNVSNREIRFSRVSPAGDLYAAVCCNGFLQLVSAKSNEWLKTLKMNYKINDVIFNTNGDRMYCATDGGLVYVYDMNTRECIHQFYDEGRVSGGRLSISRDQQYLSIGSGSGVVNVYDTQSVLLQSEPKPLKSIFNLTTEVSGLKFNSTSEILALSSHEKTNAAKLAHLPSFSIFSNFPLPAFELKRISTIQFSPSSGYFAVGTGLGSVMLYRLTHYENY